MKAPWRLHSVFSNGSHLSTIISILIFQHLHISTSAYNCQACFASCPTEDPKKCDCPADAISTCQGPYCFAKLEVFITEGHTSITKGCASEMPGQESGCYHSGYTDSISCYCEGEKCNTREGLNSFQVQPLPEVECCRCEYREDLPTYCEQVGCEKDRNNTCTGSYCFYDLTRKEQSCGYGLSPMRKNYYKNAGQPITEVMKGSDCIHAIGKDDKNFLLGCVCHGDKCNDALDMEKLYTEDLTRAFDKAEKEQSFHRCYTLAHKGPSASNATVYTRAGYCESKYCYVSYSTSRVSLSEITEEMYEDYEEGSKTGLELIEQQVPLIEAGCVRATDMENLRLGCVTEWRKSRKEPMQKTCLCKGHLCNYYTQINEDDLAKYIAHPTGREVFKKKIKEGEKVTLTIRSPDNVRPLDEAALTSGATAPNLGFTSNVISTGLIIVAVNLFLSSRR